jgi:transcriptional regulator NrdR family protein
MALSTSGNLFMRHIVKRQGHTEKYNAKKLYASIYASALANREPAGTAELIAQEVVEKVEAWIEDRHEVTSNDIRRIAGDYLKFINPDAAQIYQKHRTFHV